MASELRVNTLKDAADNNSIATSFVANGSAKVWAKATQADNSVYDSLNLTSITDDGTGQLTFTITTLFRSSHEVIYNR